MFLQITEPVTNIKIEIADEIQPVENYESSTVVFDDKLLSKQASNSEFVFTRR